MNTLTQRVGGLVAAVTTLALTFWSMGAGIVPQVLAAPTSAQITSPAPNEPVDGNVTFSALYVDGEVDDHEDNTVEWAVRADSGSCEDSNSTVAGNVDGFNDTYSFTEQNSATSAFDATVDMSEMENGDYCFVFNPSDPDEENSAREVVEFTLNNPVSDDENTLQVCKVLLDAEGQATVGGDMDAVFTLNVTSEEVGFDETAMFETDLSFNADLLADVEGQDAECISYGNLPDGEYFFGEESISADLGFETVLYNDGSVELDGVEDFEPYGDGLITLEEGVTRTITILNQFSDVPTPDPEGDNAIRVCKVLLDTEGNFSTGVGIDGDFSLTLTNDEMPGFSEQVTFDTPLSLNADLFTEVNVDALEGECTTIDNLPDGNYSYTQESITSNADFETALYYDDFEAGVTVVGDMASFNTDNDFSDGIMVLGDGEDAETQTLVVMNQVASEPLPEGDNAIRVCKVLLDTEGNVTAGADGNGTFSVTLTNEDFPGYSRTVSFTAALDLDADLFTEIDGEDAQCSVVENLPEGTYFYSEENITSDSAFETVLYYDAFEVGTTDFADLANFNTENDFSDGVIILGDTSDPETQTLLLRNQFAEESDDDGPVSGGGGGVLSPVGGSSGGVVLGATTDDDDDDRDRDRDDDDEDREELVDRLLEAQQALDQLGAVAGAQTQVTQLPVGGVAAGEGGTASKASVDEFGALALGLLLAGAGIVVNRDSARKVTS